MDLPCPWGRVYQILDDWRWLLVKPAPTNNLLPGSWGRVYQIVDDWRWLVKLNNNRRSPVGVDFTNNNCRGGFYQQNLTSTNNLNKPAPTPPITYINLDFLPFSKPISGFTAGSGGGFTRLWMIDGDCWWNQKIICVSQLSGRVLATIIVGAGFTKNI